MKDVRVSLSVGDDPPSARLLYGVDVREALRLLPDRSVQCIATSPPYWGLRDYGTEPAVWGGDNVECEHVWSESRTIRKGSTNGRSDLGSTLVSIGGEKTLAPGKANDHGDTSQYREDAHESCAKCGAWRGQLGHEPTPGLFVEHLVEVFREAWRVLREDGTLWLNLGDTFFSIGGPRTYGSSDGGAGRGPSPERRLRRSADLKAKDLVGIPWRVALALQEDGWWLRNAIIWEKANHLPSPVQDRFACTYEHVFLLTKSARYFFDLDSVRVPHTSGTYGPDGDFTPSQRWFEGGAGGRKMDQTEGQLGTHAGPPRRFGRGLYNPKGKNPGDVLRTPTQPFPGAHFAVWPESIPERCIRAGTSEHGACAACGAPWGRSNDSLAGWEPTCACEGAGLRRCIVLDPFSGSATTGAVALRLGRDYVGIDLNESYLAMATARVRNEPAPEAPQPPAIGSVLDIFSSEEE